MSMFNRAFETLGILPTDDGRVIRAAFLRLARIYHPDRFVDQPDDVRAEAERRMKEATIAYETLRVVKPEERTPTALAIDDDELRARTAKHRDAIEKERRMEENDRARWSKWEEAERRARERQRLEADIAARIRHEVDDVRVPHGPPPVPAEPDAISAPTRGAARPMDGGDSTPNGRDGLAARLDAARRGEKDPLVPQRAARR